MNIGIVGHEAAKFTLKTKGVAMLLILDIITDLRAETDSVVSGHCHLGGVDIWAEEIAAKVGIPAMIFDPYALEWKYYRQRNIEIAKASDILHVIVVRELPLGYEGMKFKLCYHCKTTEHVKSGGCWTGHYAMKLGKPAIWHLI